MPELPEVETTVRGLRKKLVGLRFVDVWADREKPFRQAGGATALKKAIVGKKILKVWRRAKFIVIDIEGPQSLFIHQKISGHLLYGKLIQKDGVWRSNERGPIRDDPKNKYLRFVFSLDNGYQLAMSDLRRFARVILVSDDSIGVQKEITRLGPEPLDVSFPDFKKLFEKKRGRIKQVLMDPFFIVGIGNIYADEILWTVGLHPLSRVEHLTETDIRHIYAAMKKILQKSIELKGSSLDDYRTPSGEKGSYQNIHKAYHRTGQPCLKKDGGVIARLVIGGRSAHFCPVHQVVK
ncbi:MAG TPA: bifunctional DNA-formamidopyrimidine glycosylase/DNA-(apurinic or apyrimidinic site) lyase [Candidatus Paceibacterota bacterium]|nr:bifunctional DNA-formamidopyrimidine glycosylase/DNA-(apurinic or apyrimidinic site) lyase [Candidatus Paceibacterota bacterium]